MHIRPHLADEGGFTAAFGRGGQYIGHNAAGVPLKKLHAVC